MSFRIIRKLEKEDQKPVELIYAQYWPDDDFRANIYKRLDGFINQAPEIIDQQFQYVVVDMDREVIGVAGIRKLPPHMNQYARSPKPLELYIIAVKNIGMGIGKLLLQKVMELARDGEYTEILVYSGETHAQSWGFYDRVGFEEVASTRAPNGEPGKIYQYKL